MAARTQIEQPSAERLIRASSTRCVTVEHEHRFVPVRGDDLRLCVRERRTHERNGRDTACDSFMQLKNPSNHDELRPFIRPSVREHPVRVVEFE